MSITIKLTSVGINIMFLADSGSFAQENQHYYYYNNFKGHIFEQKLKVSLKSGDLK